MHCTNARCRYHGRFMTTLMGNWSCSKEFCSRTMANVETRYRKFCHVERRKSVSAENGSITPYDRPETKGETEEKMNGLENNKDILIVPKFGYERVPYCTGTVSACTSCEAEFFDIYSCTVIECQNSMTDGSLYPTNYPRPGRKVYLECRYKEPPDENGRSHRRIIVVPEEKWGEKKDVITDVVNPQDNSQKCPKCTMPFPRYAKDPGGFGVKFYCSNRECDCVWKVDNDVHKV